MISNNYIYILLIVVAVLGFVFLSANNPKVSTDEISIYRDSALIRVVDREVDLGDLDIINIYGRYIMYVDQNVVGKKVKFIWNNREMEGTVEKLSDDFAIVRDNDGYYHRIHINQLLFKDREIRRIVLDPDREVYVHIDKLSWKGSSSLNLHLQDDTLEVGFIITNNNRVDFRADVLKLIDTNMKVPFYTYPILHRAADSDSGSVDVREIMDSRMVYKITNIHIPAMSKISRAVQSSRVSVNRTNHIDFYLPLYTERFSVQGNPMLMLKFRTNLDIPSGTIDIYDDTRFVTFPGTNYHPGSVEVEPGRWANITIDKAEVDVKLVKSIDIPYYPKGSDVELSLWENRKIQYKIDVLNTINRCSAGICTPEVVSSDITITLKNLNNHTERVDLRIYVNNNMDVESDQVVVDGNKLLTTVYLSPEEERIIQISLVKRG
ncbi:MAG: hypothetical protein NZ908_02260 [Candidatus Micrarchaeota archaeon]|nr:hypothetical protein [Candidatus Micrarchaeota archaeon]MCX8154518.1 hypothetical protein [Candidatus Micrarchaeota archaeon]